MRSLGRSSPALSANQPFSNLSYIQDTQTTCVYTKYLLPFLQQRSYWAVVPQVQPSNGLAKASRSSTVPCSEGKPTSLVRTPRVASSTGSFIKEPPASCQCSQSGQTPRKERLSSAKERTKW